MKYVVKPTFENLFLYGVFIVVLNVLVFGLAAPFMVSERDTAMVFLGFVVSVLMLYLDIKLVKHIVNFSKGESNEEK